MARSPWIVLPWRRNYDFRRSVYYRRRGDGRCYALAAGRLQTEAVGPSVRPRVSRGKLVVKGKDSRGVGTGEVYGAVDRLVPASTDHRSHGNGKR